jgi:hypothetical protein
MTGPMTLLVGLLFLSYLGSSIGRKRRFRIATNSGVEHAILGLALGPILLGVIERSWAETFEPIVLVGAAWLGFVSGARWHLADLPNSWASRSRGLLFGVLTVGLVTGLCWGAVTLAPEWFPTGTPDRTYILLGLLMNLPFATPVSIASLFNRYGFAESTQVLVARAAQVVPFFPVVGAMLLFGLDSHWVETKPVPLVLIWSVATPVVVGGLLGLITAGLISRFIHAEQAWGVILGTTLLGAGFSLRLGLSAVATLFFIGLTLSAFRSVRPALKELTDATERPVLLPIALLLGATLRANIPSQVFIGLGVLLAMRILSVWLAGWAARLGSNEPGLGATFGFLLTMPAALPLALGSEYSLHGASSWHMPLLVSACIGLVVHEVLGQLAMRTLDPQRTSKLPDPPQTVVGMP